MDSIKHAAVAALTPQGRLSCGCADSFRAACTKEEIELEEQQLLKSDFATSRRIQVHSSFRIMFPLSSSWFSKLGASG